MDEKPIPRGEVGREARFQRLSDLPFYYQQLGKACAELDLLSDFYWLMDAGYDFGRVFPTVCHYILQETEFENVGEVKEWLRVKYDIDLDQEDIVDDMRPKW